MTLVPLPIAPGRNPGGLIARLIDGAGALIIEQSLYIGDVDAVDAAGELAGRYAQAMPAGALWVFDGDTGALMFSYNWMT